MFSRLLILCHQHKRTKSRMSIQNNEYEHIKLLIAENMTKDLSNYFLR